MHRTNCVLQRKGVGSAIPRNSAPKTGEKDLMKHAGAVKRWYRTAQGMARVRYLRKKAVVVLMSVCARLRNRKTSRMLSAKNHGKINSSL